MPPLRETPTLPPGPLYTHYWDSHGLVNGWRPGGAKDWLLLCTELGRCVIRHPGGEFVATGGDIILYQPGTPQDYGQHDPGGRWRHVWVHWVPRAEVLEWLGWPELSPGLRHLRPPAELHRFILAELVFADAALRSGLSRAESLALNGLERALLFCHRANPRQGGPQWHPRIQDAVDYLAKNLGERHLLEDIARRFGFSRARFASLFRRQVGQSPGRYLEAQRLSRARQLLTYTNRTLAQIADETGFSSPFHLSQRFKQHFGRSPRAFRNEGE